MTDQSAEAIVAGVAAPRNGPLLAIDIILGVSAIIAFILLAVASNQSDPYFDSTGGLVTYIWAGAFLNIAILGTFAHLIVAAMRFTAGK